MERSHQQAELQYTKFSHALEQLQRALRPMLSAIDLLRSAGNEEELDPMSRARMHISLAYAVNSLFCMYLRTQGIDPATHPVAEEIARVQDAFVRMRKVEAGESTEHKQQPKRDRRKHIANARKSAAMLAALVFPEEEDLLRALQGKPGRLENEGEGNMASRILYKTFNENKVTTTTEPKQSEEDRTGEKENDNREEGIEIDSDSEHEGSSNLQAQGEKAVAGDEEQSEHKTPATGENKKKKSKKGKKDKKRSKEKRKKAKAEEVEDKQKELNKGEDKEKVKSKKRKSKSGPSSSDKREKKRKKRNMEKLEQRKE